MDTERKKSAMGHSRLRPRVARLTAAGLAVALTISMATASVATAGVTTAAAPVSAATAGGTTAATPMATSGKGPIGWDTYRRLDRIDEITTGVETHQFSSFDRTGGNDDGFAGTYSCLRTSAAGCVLAERAGAGEIESIWFTRDNGDVRATGNIRVKLDGRTVLDAPLQDVVDGRLGAPFVYPMVANADQSSGGVFIKVPMPYRSAMRVTTTVNPLFFHVTYRTFADALGVNTFDPADKALDVIGAAKKWGTADPKPAAFNAMTTNRSLSLAPGQKATLAQLSGAGEISELKLQIPQIVGPPKLPLISDDGRAHKGSSLFTVAVDPKNTGVTLTRRFDPASAQQVADILVDGVKVGQWPATADVGGNWVYQSVTLPSSATAGKSHITVKNVFVSATIDWNEFRYWVDSTVGGTVQRTDEVDVGTSAAAMASERAHQYVITGQTWTETPNQTDKPSNTDDPAILASNDLLRTVMVRVTFDGRQTVQAPLGEFFGSGLTEMPVNALFFHVDTAANGWYSSWWPMPFAARATVELVNTSDQRITAARSSVTSHRDPSVRRALTGNDATVGYFNATHHRGSTVDGQDWLFLDTAGKGRFVGVSQTIEGHIATGNLREYLEGDERVYVDGSRSPQLHGTGSEDFYEAGWYFNRREFSTPTNGATAMPAMAYGCEFQCDSPYRLMIGDAVSFHSGITFGIEHGPVDNMPADYSSTAYWYGGTAPAARVTDSIDLGDAASEKAHQYSGTATAVDVTARFEGDHDDEPVRQDVATATAAVQFTVAVDNKNTGVTLRRMSDQTTGWQSAAVTVNGRPAGLWWQPLANASRTWLEDDFQIPLALTAGRSELTIMLTPTAGAPAWSAATYQALSLLAGGKQDRDRPSGIEDLVATGSDSNANLLVWNAAADDVAVHGYQIYASTAPDFPVGAGAATLVGTSTLSSFRHTGLGLNQTWFYRVRAVDSSGNLGPLSDVVSATTGNTVRIEGESLLPAINATAPVEAQGECCGANWSAGGQLWFRGAKVGDTVTVGFDVPVTGTFDVSAVLTRAADYGIAQFAIDGDDLGQPVDNYQAAGVGTVTRELGSLGLTAGPHSLTMTATAKNAAALSYMIGLDVLELQLVV